MSPRARRLCLAGFVAASFLSFPHPVLGTVVDAGLIFAWLAPALLIMGLEGLAPRRAGITAYLVTVAAHGAILHWIYVVTVTYGHAPPPVGVVAPFGLALYTASFSGVFGLALAWTRSRNIASPLLTAALWTALDHGRSFILTGFPWATIGYAQHDNVALLGLAPYAGVYALSFVTVLVAAGLAEAALAMRAGRGIPRRAVAALVGALVLHGVGLVLPANEIPATAPRVRVAALQGNIEQGVKWSPEWAGRTLEIYDGLAREAAAAGARVIVWPETAVPGSVEYDPELERRLATLVRETGAVHVIGGVGVEAGTEPRSFRYYDSAFFVHPETGFGERYDKSHLVPFGEYVPLRDFLGSLIGAVARGIASRDVSSGSEPRAVEVSLGGVDDDLESMLVGVPICYELLFPDLVRRFVGGGAQVLFAITNDAWYGRTGAPYQFLAITALRSAETGTWIVRAANTGVSAFIDERGRVRDRTRIFERGWLMADVPLRPAGEGGGPKTFYARHGDVFAWSCWLVSAAAIFMAARRASRGEKT